MRSCFLACRSSQPGNRTDLAFRPGLNDRSWRRDGTYLLATLGTVAAVLLVTMPEFIYRGDPVAIRASTVCLLNAGRLDVPTEYARTFGEKGQWFFENPSNGKWYPKYGILNSFLYLPPLLIEKLQVGQLRFTDDMDWDGVERRCLYLNLYNVFLSLVLASYLYRTARRLDASPAVAMTYVLAACFGTFLWTYLRAQTVEIFQVLFFSAAFYHLLRLCQPSSSANAPRQAASQVLLAMFYVGLLVLAKLSYLPLLPLAAVIVWRAGRRTISVCGDASSRRLLASCVVGPLLATCVLVLLANEYRFGSPWATGYQQWERERNLFSARVWEGAFGYLVDPQKSILLYFPLLPLAFLKLRSFGRRWPLPMAFAWMSFAVLYALNSAFINWRGDWCYGPRYLLVALPVLGLPVLGLLGEDGRWRLWAPALVGSLFVGSLATINSPLSIHGESFFAAFEAQGCFATAQGSSTAEYFRRPQWSIHRDLRRFRLGRSGFPPMDELRSQLSARDDLVLRERLHSLPWGNYYLLHQMLLSSEESSSLVSMRRISRLSPSNSQAAIKEAGLKATSGS